MPPGMIRDRESGQRLGPVLMWRRSPALLWAGLIGAVMCAAQTIFAAEAHILDVRKIWDAAPHNAFTDLLRWHDRWWCTFRESEAHVGGDGRIRIITSLDGKKWAAAGLLSETNVDLRDPKLSVTPDDRLMIVAGGSVYLGTKVLKGFQSRVMFSDDGRTWSAPARVLGEGEWLWRVTWHEGMAYGAAYQATSATTNGPLNLYRSNDGLKWERVSSMNLTGEPNETTLRFSARGELLALVRRDAGNRMGVVGRAKPPFTEWVWHELNYQLGGPDFMEVPAEGWVVATRDYTKKQGATTLVGRLTADSLQPLVTLPSGGDTSYPGLAWHDEVLWVSYHSSQEGKTSIYLARVKLEPK